MNRPQLWLVAGPNGAGKSTLADRFGRGRIPIVNPDTIAYALPRGAEGRLAQGEAGRIASRERSAHLAAGRTFGMESTLSGRGELKLMRDAAAAGYKVNLVYVGLPNPMVSSTRVGARVKLGGHDIPPEDIDRRYPRSMANLPEAMAIAQRSFVFDNGGRRHRLILIHEDGRVRFISDRVPRWVKAALAGMLSEA